MGNVNRKIWRRQPGSRNLSQIKAIDTFEVLWFRLSPGVIILELKNNGFFYSLD